VTAVKKKKQTRFFSLPVDNSESTTQLPDQCIWKVFEVMLSDLIIMKELPVSGFLVKQNH
jgi:hypothetical protein